MSSGLFNSVTRSAVLTAIEKIFNNVDSPILLRALEFVGIDLSPHLLLIKKVKRMISHLTIDVDDKKNILKVALRLAGESSDLIISANYSKKTKGSATKIQLTDMSSSKEWMTILVNDILIGEGIIAKEDMSFNAEGAVGKLLDKIL